MDFTFQIGEDHVILSFVSIVVSRYKVGQRFGCHIDESVNLGEGRRTQYTLLIYLSGDLCSKTRHGLDKTQDSSIHSLVGGETVFYDESRGIVAEVLSSSL